MKRGTLDHPKTLHLARLLGVQRWGAIGILESLWHFAAKHALRGDVGRWSDEQIAEAIGWTDNPERLIEALVQARWLERSAEHRLIVHDWHDHADDSVRKTLRNRNLTFATLPVSQSGPKDSEPFAKSSETVAPAVAVAVAVADTVAVALPKPLPNTCVSVVDVQAQATPTAAEATARTKKAPAPASESRSDGKAKPEGEDPKPPAGNQGGVRSTHLRDELGTRLRVMCPRNGDAKAEAQYQVDRQTLLRVAQRIVGGELGDVSRVVRAALDKAEDIGTSATVKRPMAAFTTWWKGEIERRGLPASGPLSAAVAGMVESLAPP
jgi:hypothetical protein